MKKWFVVAVITTLATVCVAQTKPPVKKEQPIAASAGKQKSGEMQAVAVKPKPKKAPVVKFSMGIIEGDRIDANFAGTSVRDLADAIVKRSGQEKGEFESTADFSARKSAALGGKILGDSSTEDAFAFVSPVAKVSRLSNGFKYDFDADTSEVQLFALPDSQQLNGIGAQNYKANSEKITGMDLFDLNSKTESQNTYEGSNGYGVKVTVEKTIMSTVGMAASKIPFLTFKREKFGYFNPTAVAQFKMENGRAERELPALKVLVVMKLADPFVAYHFDRKEPKRDSPTDVSMQWTYLTGNILGMVFYSGLTGEVFLRLPENFGKPEPKLEPKPEIKPAA